jgi:hypothetical protein
MIAPRFRWNGGDKSKFFVIESVVKGKGAAARNDMFLLARDIDKLEKLILSLQKTDPVELIIIDPITSYLGTSKMLDAHRAQDVRNALDPYAHLARRLGLAILLIAHLNKSSLLGAIYRFGGSASFVEVPRASWFVVRDKDDPQLRYFQSCKVQAAYESKGLSFRIPKDSAIVITDEEVPSADDLLAAPSPKEKETKQKRAEQFLKELFEEKSEIAAAEAIRAAKEQGISESTLGIARRNLRIKSVQMEDGHFVWAPLLKK